MFEYWSALRTILDQLNGLLGDHGRLETKYGIILIKTVHDDTATANEANGRVPRDMFHRLFHQRSANWVPTLQCTVMNMGGAQHFLDDVSQLIGQTLDTLDSNERTEMRYTQYRSLQEAVVRSVSASDREIVRQLAQRTFDPKKVQEKRLDSNMLEEDLLNAIDADDSAAVEFLLDGGASADYQGALGCSPLLLSARQGRLCISQILLSHVANPNAITTWLPQHSAAEGGHTEVLRLLLSQDKTNASAVDSYGRTVLHYASGSGILTTVKFLLELDNIAVDSVDEGGLTPLFHAVAGAYSTLSSEPGVGFKSNETEIIRRLLAVPEVNPNRPHPGYDGYPLLSTFISRKDSTMVKMILARPDIDIHGSSSQLPSPISIALSSSNEQAFLLLQEKGVRCRDQDIVWVPQTYRACQSSAMGFLDSGFLLDFTLHHRIVNVNETNEYRRTVLSEAAEKGHTKIVAMLLDKNAEGYYIRHRDKKRYSPLILAIANLRPAPEHDGSNQPSQQYMDMVRTLLERSAKPEFVSSTDEFPGSSMAQWVECMRQFKKIVQEYYDGLSKTGVGVDIDVEIL
ncbi:MAG: hypothetical protein Q9169_002379 [Polycauliona sp. 2 TL-2023]